MAYTLTHPSFEHEKEYRVLVEGQPDEATLQRWREGVWLNGEMTAPAQVSIEKEEFGDGKTARRRSRVRQDNPPDTIGDSDAGTWLRVVLHEGRKRQIKRVAKLLGHPVKQLIRIRIGTLHLGNLKPQEWRHLSEAEVTALKGQPSSAGIIPEKIEHKPKKNV